MHISATPLPPQKQGHRPADPHLVPRAQCRPWRRSRGLGDFDEGMRKGRSLWLQSWPHPGPRCQIFLPSRTTHYQPCSGTPGTSPMAGPAPPGPGRGWSSNVRIGLCWGWLLPSGWCSQQEGLACESRIPHLAATPAGSSPHSLQPSPPPTDPQISPTPHLHHHYHWPFPFPVNLRESLQTLAPNLLPLHDYRAHLGASHQPTGDRGRT